MTSNRIELLAPAGSMEILKAAISAGADAVYVGGSRFGARAYADNFDEQTLVEAIHYVHVHGKKLYLTVNTLFRQEELEDLYAFLKAPYEAGLDAVIVQDFGVACYIKGCFPALALHISTQMTITQQAGARYLEKLGAERIVPARELSFAELAQIKQTGLEVEVFVHGALCYCYSGQCLLSSMIGGRSGNRGRCAQPCRLPYHTEDETAMPPYILSPRDLCGLEAVPELIDMGIDSLKIEGRMKNAYYVAATVSAYRRAVDAVYAGTFSASLIDELRQELAEIYNRGGFTKGYFSQQNGPDMMSMERPNHQGTPVGVIEKVHSGTIAFTTERGLNKGDVVTVQSLQGEELSLTVPDTYPCGMCVTLKAPKTRYLKPGMAVYRTRNAKMHTELEQTYLLQDKKEKIKIEVIIQKDKCATITMIHGDSRVTVEGETVQQAKKQPISRDIVIEKLGRFGETPFQAAEITVHMDADAFISVGGLNALRRRAVEALTQTIVQATHRPSVLPAPVATGRRDTDKCSMPVFSAQVSDSRVLEVVLSHLEVKRIYLDCIQASDAELCQCAERIRAAKRELIVCMPHVGRYACIQTFYRLLEKLGKVDGVLVRNVDSFASIREQKPSMPVIGDWSLYAYNREAVSCYQREAEDMQFVMPRELSYTQIKRLWGELGAGTHLICDIYGNVPVMVSAQCIRKNLAGCDKQSGSFRFQDRKQVAYTAQSVCRYCYTLLYNEVTYSLLSKLDDVMQLGAAELRMLFRQEKETEIHAVIASALCVLQAQERQMLKKESGPVTGGHFRRGIE